MIPPQPRNPEPMTEVAPRAWVRTRNSPTRISVKVTNSLVVPFTAPIAGVPSSVVELVRFLPRQAGAAPVRMDRCGRVARRRRGRGRFRCGRGVVGEDVAGPEEPPE